MPRGVVCWFIDLNVRKQTLPHTKLVNRDGVTRHWHQYHTGVDMGVGGDEKLEIFLTWHTLIVELSTSLLFRFVGISLSDNIYKSILRPTLENVTKRSSHH